MNSAPSQTQTQTPRPEEKRSACVEVLLPNAIIDVDRICSDQECLYVVRIQHRRDRLVSTMDRFNLPLGLDYDRLRYVVDNLIKFVSKANSFEVARAAVAKLLSEINIHVNPKWVVAVWLDACGY